MRRKIIKMNSKAKSIITLIVLGIIFALSPIISNSFNFNARNSVDFTLDKDNLKISAVSGKIHIDNNWTAAKSAGICTGNGTYSEPYVIEDLVINGEGSGSCILIENSNVYFRIENCTLFNSGYGYVAGIRLESVSNGILLNNTASIDNQHGIYLRYSNDNVISGNNASYNGGNGMYLYRSDNANISGNIANYNGENGMYLYDSDNGNISGNIASYNGENGMYLYDSDNANISGNIASYNGGNGMHLYSSYNANISGNIMNKCGLGLIGGIFASHHIDTTNLVNGKPLYYYTNEVNLGANNFTNAGQIIMVNCDDSVISNVNISYTSIGINCFYCDNNEISGSTVVNNRYGISLMHCDNNNILGNNATYNEYSGIFLADGMNNLISGNNANNNDEKGIYLNYCDENTVSGNTVDNNRYGIYLRKSEDNKISGNTIKNNNFGIYLECSCFNDITGNIFIGNSRDLYEDQNSCCIVGTLERYLLIGILSFSLIAIFSVGVKTMIRKKKKKES